MIEGPHLDDIEGFLEPRGDCPIHWLGSTPPIEETRRELAEIEARRQAQGFKAILRQLKGDEEADRNRAEALQQMLARGEALLTGALKVIDEAYARKKLDLERRHEAEKQGRFEYERVKEERQAPTRQVRPLFTPAPQANLRPRTAPGYGRPTAGEKQARIITGLTGERANPDPIAPTPPLTGLHNRPSVRGAFRGAKTPLERPAVPQTRDAPEATLGAVFAAQTFDPELGRWIEGRRRALQQRHAAQQARLMKELDKDLFPARQAIDNAANPRISAALREIKAIEERQQAPGLAGRFARMQHPNDPQRAQIVQRELEEIRTRRDEALEELERQKETHERTRALRDQHAQEGAALDIEIARVVDSGRVPEGANENRPPTPARAEDRDRIGEDRSEDEKQDSLEQGRGGRSRER